MNKKRKREVGMRFGRLVITEINLRIGNNELACRVKCDCGTEKIIRFGSLYAKRGATVSCGCKAKEHVPTPITVHGMSKTKTYYVWRNMNQRCSNPNTPMYKNYGGRGIKVCERWIDSFENFLADMGEKPKRLSIGRINNDGDYEPNNCRWETNEQQTYNRKFTVRLTVDNVTRTINEWSRISGVSRRNIYIRIHDYGWSARDAIFTPQAKRSPRKLTVDSGSLGV